MHINIYLDNLNYRYDVYQMFNIFYTFHELKFVNDYTKIDDISSLSKIFKNLSSLE